MENGTYKGTTWQVKFELDDVDNQATYKLRVALASVSLAELQVYQISTFPFPKKLNCQIILFLNVALS